jgi:hypothetical protein
MPRLRLSDPAPKARAARVGAGEAHRVGDGLARSGIEGAGGEVERPRLPGAFRYLVESETRAVEGPEAVRVSRFRSSARAHHAPDTRTKHVGVRVAGGPRQRTGGAVQIGHREISGKTASNSVSLRTRLTWPEGSMIRS